MAQPIQPVGGNRLPAHASARSLERAGPPAAVSPWMLRGCASRLALVALLACVAIARPATAAEGLYLTWDDCFQGPTHSSTRVFPCQDNTTAHELYCAFTMPQPADQVIAMEVVVDIQHSATAMPDWWRMDQGGCRATSISVAADFPGKSACLNSWQGAATPAQGFLASYVVTDPHGLASQARIRATASVLPQDAVTLDGSSMYYGVRIIIDSAKTVDPGPACGGCGLSACLVLNSILIGRKPGAAGGDILVQVPGPGGANWARWQGGGADCAAVPVRRHTWGFIKSLYR